MTYSINEESNGTTLTYSDSASATHATFPITRAKIFDGLRELLATPDMTDIELGGVMLVKRADHFEIKSASTSFTVHWTAMLELFA